MSLWTPYTEEPLDLRKQVKEERRSPFVEYPYPYPQYITPVPGMGIPPPEYAVPQPMYPYPDYSCSYGYPSPSMPSTQLSPVSTGSPCSGCELEPSPYYRPVTLSPPVSPQQNYIADAEMLSDDPDFQAFERDALRAMAEKNGGTLLGNNPRMRRAVQTSQVEDDSYRKQRERNNFAAKQSRDRRKLREIHLSLKVAYLKTQLTKLKTQLAVTTCVRCQSVNGQ